MSEKKECQGVATGGNPYKSFKEGVKVMASVAYVIIDRMAETPDEGQREDLSTMFKEICFKLLGDRS